MGCGSKEEPRVVSKDVFAEDYANAMCSVQLGCDLIDDREDCIETVERQWDGKVDTGCFDGTLAGECLDILETMTCAQYEDGAYAICADVVDCSEV